MRFEYSDPTTTPTRDRRAPQRSSFSLREFDPRSVVIAVLAAGAAAALSPRRIHGTRRRRIVRGGRRAAVFALVFRPPAAAFLAGRRDGETRAQRERGSRALAVRGLLRRDDVAACTASARDSSASTPGALAALLLNISAVFSLTTGGWVLPDGPLMLFMLASVTVIADILFDGASASAPHQVADALRPARVLRGPDTLRWVVAGVFTGLAMLSKYHGVFVLAGTFLFLLTSAPHRKWLARPGPYLGALVALAMFCAGARVEPRARTGCRSRSRAARAAGGGGLHFGAMLQPTSRARPGTCCRGSGCRSWCCCGARCAAGRATRRDGSSSASASGRSPGFTLIALRGDAGTSALAGAGIPDALPAARRGGGGPPRARRRADAALVEMERMDLRRPRRRFSPRRPRTDGWSAWRPRCSPRAIRRRTWSHGASCVRRSMPRTCSRTGSSSRHRAGSRRGRPRSAPGPDVPVLCLCADPHHFYYMNDDRSFLGRDAVFVKKLKRE